jgi:hypothetical protein
LNFGTVNLQFAVFPAMLPIPLGTHIPLDHPIAVFFDGEDQAVCPMLEHWRKALI